MTVKSKVNQDLQDERNKISFNVEEFTNWYYGSEANVKDKRYLGECDVCAIEVVWMITLQF